MGYRAIIFDCDGVLVDSEPYSCGAWNVLLAREYQVEVNREYSAILGKSTKDTVEYYKSTYNLPIPASEYRHLADKKEQVYYELARGRLSPVTGIISFLDSCLHRKIPIAVASSGTKEKIQFNLTEGGITSYFQHIISAEDIHKGKPDPEIFLLAAECLHIPIEECIIIEDSITGVLAAKRSEALTIAITTTFPRADLQKADLIIDSYEEIELDTWFQ